MSTHIFQNLFYKKDPIPNWSFDVFIEVPVADGKDVIEKNLSDAVKDVKVPALQLGTITTSFKGLQFNLPTRYENTGSLEISFAEDHLLTTYKNFVLNLYNRSFNNINYYDSGSDGFYFSDEERKDVKDYKDIKNTYWRAGEYFNCHVAVNDPKTNKTVKLYSFYDCYVESVSDINLDYSKTDEVIEYTCIIKYNAVDTNSKYFNKK